MQKRLFTGIGLLLLAGAVLAQAYRWVDKDGIVHFSDRPGPGAELVLLPTSRPSSAAVATRAPISRAPQPVQDGATAQEQPFSYESLSIASPAAEETLWNIEGVLSVSLNLQPGLQSGHQVRVYFNGTPQIVSGTSFQLEQVYRGQHNLQAEVIDQSGRLMIRSEPSRFFVQQNAIRN